MKQIFRTADCKFEEADPKLLRYTKPCTKGHCDSKGRGVRLIHSGACLACQYKMQDGSFAHDFGDEVRPKKSLRQYSDEEGKARHIKRVMQWQKNNKDKVRPVQQKYNQKEEVKQRCRDAYQATKTEKQERQKKYYWDNRTLVLARQKAAYARKHPKFDNTAFDTTPYDQA